MLRGIPSPRSLAAAPFSASRSFAAMRSCSRPRRWSASTAAHMMAEQGGSLLKLFNGLSAFPLTPTDAAGHLQADVLCRFLERIREAGANSIGLLGSTGGYAYLTREQRQRALRA